MFHWPQLVPKLVILAQSCLTRPSANATSTAEVQGQECCHRNSEPARKAVIALTSRLPISTTWHKRDNCIRSATVKPNHRLLSMPCAQSGMEAAESRNPQVTAVATRELSSGCARHSGLTLCYPPASVIAVAAHSRGRRLHHEVANGRKCRPFQYLGEHVGRHLFRRGVGDLDLAWRGCRVSAKVLSYCHQF